MKAATRPRQQQQQQPQQWQQHESSNSGKNNSKNRNQNSKLRQGQRLHNNRYSGSRGSNKSRFGAIPSTTVVRAAWSNCDKWKHRGTELGLSVALSSPCGLGCLALRQVPQTTLPPGEVRSTPPPGEAPLPPIPVEPLTANELSAFTTLQPVVRGDSWPSSGEHLNSGGQISLDFNHILNVKFEFDLLQVLVELV